MYCQECGKIVGDDAKFCQNCGKEIKRDLRHANHISVTSDVQGTIVKYNNRGNVKIGGFLYVVSAIILIRLVISLLLFAAYIPSTFICGAYIKHIAPIYDIDIVFIALYIIYNSFVIKLFFTNKKSFVKHCMIFLFLPVVFNIVEAFILYIASEDIDKICIVIHGLIKPMFIYSLFCSAIGVYLNQSKRVEQTFTK